MPRLDPVALCIVAASVPVRIALAIATELSPDEAYYLCASRLKFAIPDHPPLLLWLLRLTDRLLPGSIELRARLPALALGVCVSLLLVEIVRRRTDNASSQRWAALLGSWLILPLAGGFLTTPDAPAIAAIAVLLLANHIQRRKLGIVAAAVAAFGGMLSKVVVGPFALLVALNSARPLAHRLAIVAGVAASLPLAFPSLAFQSHHAFVAPTWTAGAALALGAAIAAQLGLWTPILPALAVRRLSSMPPEERWAILGLAVLFFGSAILRGVPPEPNWIAPAWLPILAAASLELPKASPLTRRALLFLGPGLALVAASHALHGWLPINRSADPTARLHGWRSPSPPLDAPGVGIYGPDAEACVYAGACDRIYMYFQEVTSKNLKSKYKDSPSSSSY